MTSQYLPLYAPPVPVPHYGAALSVDEFHQLAMRLQEKGVKFEIQPHLRFQVRTPRERGPGAGPMG
jgi:extradiol dioxygenase family protein